MSGIIGGRPVIPSGGAPNTEQLESDVADIQATLAGLGDAATKDVGTASGTVMAGDDTRINRWDGGSTGLTASTGRTSLGLGSAAVADIGVGVQAYHVLLAAISGLSSIAANRIIWWNSTDTPTLATVTSYGMSLLASASADALRQLFGVFFKITSSSTTPVNNSTVLVTSGLSFSGLSAGNYLLFAPIDYITGTTPQIKVQFVVTNGTLVWSAIDRDSGAAVMNTESTAGSYVGHTSGSAQRATIVGRLTSSGAGSIDLQFAQNTANASNTYCRGSMLLIGPT